jgi:hypothetical protein
VSSHDQCLTERERIINFSVWLGLGREIEWRLWLDSGILLGLGFWVRHKSCKSDITLSHDHALVSDLVRAHSVIV